MKIFKISAILSLLRTQKYEKNFLRFINIGIFLSLFAISSALITFFIELKIHSLQNEKQIYIKEYKENIKMNNEMTRIKSQFNLFMNKEREIIDLYNLYYTTNVGAQILTENDVYLPVLFFEALDIADIDFFNFPFDTLNKMAIDDYKKENFVTKGLVRESNKIKQNLSFMEDIKSKYLIYEPLIFDYGLEFVRNDLKRSVEGTSIYFGAIYEDYETLNNIVRSIVKYFTYFELYLYDYVDDHQIIINNYENEIKKYYNNENTVIIFAFLFQLLIFLIIQFFEIRTTQMDLIKNEKRKIK